MIITEQEKSKVIFSSLFERHYPELFDQLGVILWNHHRGYGCVCHTKDYWVRDFMPIQADEDVFVKFVFNPDYLQDQRKYISDVDKVLRYCPFAQNYKMVEVPLVVDGGNMVFCSCYKSPYLTIPYVIMTEKVLSENPGVSMEQIEALMKGAFQEHNLIVVWLPWDRDDIFGHTDGIVHFVGGGTSGRAKVLVNLNLYEDDIANRMYEALAKYFEVVELNLSEYDELSWAYINCLHTQDFIIVPGIGNAITDAEAMKQYRELFPNYEGHIYQVQMRDFIKENGGALNCCTWTIKDEG